MSKPTRLRRLSRRLTGARVTVCALAYWTGRRRSVAALDVICAPYDLAHGNPARGHCARDAAAEGLGDLPDPIRDIRRAGL